MALSSGESNLLPQSRIAGMSSQARVTPDTSALRDEALRQFRVNIELWSELELGYERYGAALAQVGRNEEAATQYRIALRLDTGGPTHLRASILYQLAVRQRKRSKEKEHGT
jgi:hypothetical protein